MHTKLNFKSPKTTRLERTDGQENLDGCRVLPAEARDVQQAAVFAGATHSGPKLLRAKTAAMERKDLLSTWRRRNDLEVI